MSARRSYLALCGHIYRRGSLYIEREREREIDVIVGQCLLVAPTLLYQDTDIEEEAYVYLYILNVASIYNDTELD